MKYRLLLNFVFTLILTYTINGQPDSLIIDTTHTFQRVLVDGTDTLYIADLEDIDISAVRLFENDDDYKLFLRYKRSAVIVFPYAKEAVDTYRRILEETADLKRGKKRKFVRELNKEYKSDYKDKFKNMTRTQGKVMIKMIEQELDISFFELIKEVKGGFTATYWDALSKLYGYHLKEKYQRGEDSLLDSVLDEYANKLKVQNPALSN
ncbi:MAG: DUF4294 domain-containing protein [Saprospiraceae bacterium]